MFGGVGIVAELLAQLDDDLVEGARGGTEAMKTLYTLLRRLNWRGTGQAAEPETRVAPGANLVETLWQDLRFGLRVLGKNPGFTAVVVLTLALGIGASSAVYSVVNSVLLNPLPGPSSNRLMEIAEEKEYGVSAEVLAAVKSRGDFFSDFARCRGVALWTRKDDFKAFVRGETVSPNFFSFFNIRPLLGRSFARDEAVPADAKGMPERDSAIIISYAWWKSQFAGGADVIGKTVQLSERRFTVVGVMPPHFQYPLGGERSSLWVPTEDPRPAFDGERSSDYRLLVRLKPGVPRQQTQAMLDLVGQQQAQERAAEDPAHAAEKRPEAKRARLLMRPCADSLTSDYVGADDLPRTLYGLLAVIGFVLLIVCLNLANLMLTRTERRQQELAVRAALGAGRGRLARQLVTEAVLLTGLGGVAGLAVTAGGIRLLRLLIPPVMPRLKPLEIDASALGFTLVVSAVVGLALGLASAWQASRGRLSETLKQAGMGATAGRSRSRFQGALVVAEVALSLVLLTGAGLMIQSVARLLRVNPGFDPENLVSVHLWLPSKYVDSDDSPNARPLRNALWDRMHERLAALPGVKAVGIWGGGFEGRGDIRVDGREELLNADGIGCGVEQSDFLRVMRVPLRAGRYLNRSDTEGKDGAAIINESMARLCWPGQNALGRRFRLADSPGGNVFEVAGIVADVRPVRLTQRVYPHFYRPYHQAGFDGAMLFVIRAERDPQGLVPAILAELKAAEPDMPHPRVQVARQTLDESTQAQRTYMGYLVGFAAVGLLLSALGIYGVLAYSVARRAREIGIRLAVGGQRRDVLGLVMWEGARLVGAGAGLGLLGAFWLLQLVRHMVFHVGKVPSVEEGPVSQLLKYHLFQAGAADPLVWSGTVVLLLGVALFACWLPARRATRIDPMKALRCE
jgi:putative ABC transport system permease protein